MLTVLKEHNISLVLRGFFSSVVALFLCRLFSFFYLLKEKKPSTKVFKVDRFEVAETGASFLLIIARLSKTLEVYS